MLKLAITAAIIVTVLCLAFIIGVSVARADDNTIEFNNLTIGELAYKGFEVSERTTAEIFATGGRAQWGDRFSAFGWIIDAKDREIIWSMNEDCYDINKISSYLAECEEMVTLRPGQYEAYFYVGHPNKYFGDISSSIKGLGDVIAIIGDAIFSESSLDEYAEEDVAELYMTIRTSQPVKTYEPSFEDPAGTILHISRPEGDAYISEGFELSRPTELHIHAIGEFSDSYDLFVDGGWIVDAESRKRVWKMDKWNTDWAGGARKNRFFFDSVTLPAGKYIAYFVTDDSHHAGSWNSAPPGDPMNYGLLVKVVEPQDMAAVSDFDMATIENELLAITRVRDNDLSKASFKLERPADLRVFALGERDYDDDLADYGWIIDAESMSTVWRMTPENTEFAGGAAKNCMFDGVVQLNAGTYTAYYRTDGSHSYEDWNAAPPFEHHKYGLTIYSANGNVSSYFKTIDLNEPVGNMLANLTGLGDDEEAVQSFSLSGTTEIRIIAIGEGLSGTMYDYGWIENEDTGEIIWEMTYRKTGHAGGADKNRSVVANIILPEGRYSAHFITDGSHSFRDFNASPPDDPERWGMLVTKQ